MLPIKIKLPNGFLDEEVRCGYTVSAQMKKIWAVQLDLMQRFHEVCSEHDIKYSIFWGTLLGAVRHKGMIPWDDDLDVIVDRENFNKLRKLSQDEFGYPYFLQTGLNDRERFGAYARFRNSLTTGAISGEESLNYNNGMYIDVYVFDGVAPNRFLYCVQTLLKHVALTLLFSKYAYKRKKRGVYRLLSLFTWFVPFRVLYWLYERTLTMYECFSDKIGAVSSFKDKDHFCYWIRRSDFQRVKTVPYEFLSFNAIDNGKDFLIRRYGKYEAFPPVNERGKWHEGVVHFDPEIPYRDYLKSK